MLELAEKVYRRVYGEQYPEGGTGEVVEVSSAGLRAVRDTARSMGAEYVAAVEAERGAGRLCVKLSERESEEIANLASEMLEGIVLLEDGTAGIDWLADSIDKPLTLSTPNGMASPRKASSRKEPEGYDWLAEEIDR